MLKQEQTIANLNIFNLDFFEILDQEIKKNPEIVNILDASSNNKTFLHKSAYGALVKHIAYFLEKGANIYLSDNEQLNPLRCVVGCLTVFKKRSQLEEVKDCYQIFKILLHYEAEQRAYFPEQYKTPWLKDQKDSTNYTPLNVLEKFHYPDKEKVIKDFKNILQEAERYYQKCLQNKANNVVLEPYHRQFLPEIKNKEIVAENAEVKWSDKVIPQSDLHQRRRAKSGEAEASKKETSMKPLSRSEELENFNEHQPLLGGRESWTEWFLKGFRGDDSHNKVVTTKTKFL